MTEVDALRHQHVIGPTGMGKSTLLLNQVVQDMSAGRGLAVIDPKGDLVADVLDRVPGRRRGDVILIDPSDIERPVGLNLLTGTTNPELVADHIAELFRGMFSAFWGPRTDDIMRASLLTLATRPGMTLCELPLLLTNGRFRNELLREVDDPVGLGSFWTWYEALKENDQMQVIGPMMNKLRAFLLRASVRHILGQSESTFDMDKALNNRHIVLVSLSKGAIGAETAALLGSLFILRLWQAVQRRVNIPAGERDPFFCYVDEFQDYLHLPLSLADVLAQARSFRFGLIMAHQHLGQLPNQLREAVLANTRTKVVFQTSAADANVLAREFAPYLTAQDLLTLEPYEVALMLPSGSEASAPATGITLPPPQALGSAAAIRAASRERYGRLSEEVEQAIRARHAISSEPVRRKRRA